MVFTPVQTERLTLRAYVPSDIPALMPLIGAREVAATTLRIPHPYTESDAQSFIAGMQKDLSGDSGLRLGIVLRASDTLCGGVGLRIETDHRRAELGYWIAPPYHGQGHATRAVSLMMQLMITELKLHRAEAYTQMDNLASQHVLRRNGFVPYGVARSHIFTVGQWRDEILWERLLD